MYYEIYFRARKLYELCARVHAEMTRQSGMTQAQSLNMGMIEMIRQIGMTPQAKSRNMEMIKQLDIQLIK